MNIFSKPRYDCFVVWGHGQSYLSDILHEIRSEECFEIVHFERLEVGSIKKLVRQIYSFDYAPLFHLKAKVKYLEASPPVVSFIFAKNKDAQEEFFGDGEFRHIESLRVKNFKDRIREKFNPRCADGSLSHDHVIHATDNESQTDEILKLIGYKKGIGIFKGRTKIIPSPHYIHEPTEFSIKEVSYDDILAANFSASKGKVTIKHISIEESAQYKGINAPSAYSDYLYRYSGDGLKQDYDPEKYLKLKEDFEYLSDGYRSEYVIVSKAGNGKFIIVDGLHRAALHRYQGHEFLKVCVV